MSVEDRFCTGFELVADRAAPVDDWTLCRQGEAAPEMMDFLGAAFGPPGFPFGIFRIEKGQLKK